MFTKGLKKVAVNWGTLAKNMSSELVSGSKAFLRGVKDSGAQSVSTALNPMKSLRPIGEAVKAHGGFASALRSKAGREQLANAIGKASPGIGAAAAYTYAGKKLYDKSLGTQPPYMSTNYYGV